MITRTHALPVVRQCHLMEFSQPTAYDQPTPVSATDQALIRRIDELHLDHPFAELECCATCSGEMATRSGASECAP